MPFLKITSVHVLLPQEGGLVLRVRATKPKDFVIKQVRARFEGEAFWSTLAAVFGRRTVAAFRVAAHPIGLKNGDTLRVRGPQQGESEVLLDVVLGAAGSLRASKQVMEERIKAVIEKGNPYFTFLLEHGEHRLMKWRRDGTLFSIRTCAGHLYVAALSSGILPLNVRNSSEPKKGSRYLRREDTEGDASEESDVEGFVPSMEVGGISDEEEQKLQAIVHQLASERCGSDPDATPSDDSRDFSNAVELGDLFQQPRDDESSFSTGEVEEEVFVSSNVPKRKSSLIGIREVRIQDLLLEDQPPEEIRDLTVTITSKPAPIFAPRKGKAFKMIQNSLSSLPGWLKFLRPDTERWRQELTFQIELSSHPFSIGSTLDPPSHIASLYSTALTESRYL